MASAVDSAQVHKGGRPIAFQAAGPAPLVGRDAELGLLVDRLDAARAGRGGLVLLGGEPGIGKTRLLHELLAHATAAGVRTVSSRCREDGGAPASWPWVQVLRALVTDPNRRPTPVPGLYAQRLGPGWTDIERLINSTPGQPDAASRFRLFDAVCTMVRLAGEGSGLVIVIDDLHRADEPSVLLTPI